MTTDTPRAPGRPSGSALLTPQNAALALAKHQAGATYDDLAADFACSRSSIMRLLNIARANTSPQKFAVQRTGAAPLEFSGALRVSVNGETLHTKPGTVNNDYWTITIFDLPDGSHVVAITYRKTHRGIRTEHNTGIATTDVAQTLRSYDPLSVLQGFPPGERFAASQAKLEQAARLQYDTLVSMALADAPDEPQPQPTPQRSDLTPRQIILDLAKIADLTTETREELRTCSAERAYRMLSEELRSISDLIIDDDADELAASVMLQACSKALDLAIDCALGTLNIDG